MPLKHCDVHVWYHFSPEVDDHTPNLDDLMNDVAAVIPAKWRLVGVQLKLPNGTLDEIQAQNAGRPDDSNILLSRCLIDGGVWGLVHTRGRP